MKNLRLKRILALTLIISCLSSTLLVFADSGVNGMQVLQSTDNMMELIDSEGNVVRVELYEKDGVIYGEQYLNGELDGTAEMKRDSEVLKSTNAKNITTYSRVATRSSYKKKGTLNYTDDDGFDYDGHSINVYLKKGTKQSQYDLKTFKGKVVDLCVIVAGSINIPLLIAKKFVQALIYNALLTVSSGWVKSIVGIKTLACLETKYSWKVEDADETSINDTFTGYRYEINAEGEDEYGDVYKEGFTESDYRSNKFKLAVHQTIFSY